MTLALVALTAHAGGAATTRTLQSALGRGFEVADATEQQLAPGDVLDLRTGQIMATAADCMAGGPPELGERQPFTLVGAGSDGLDVAVSPSQLPAQLRVGASGSHVARYSDVTQQWAPSSTLVPSSACIDLLVAQRRDQGRPREPGVVEAVLFGDVEIAKTRETSVAVGAEVPAGDAQVGFNGSLGTSLVAQDAVVAFRAGRVPGYPYVPTGWLIEGIAGLPTEVRVAYGIDSALRRVGIGFGAVGGRTPTWTGDGVLPTPFWIGFVRLDLHVALGPFREGPLKGLEFEAVGAVYTPLSALWVHAGAYSGGGGNVRWGPPSSRYWVSAGVEVASTFQVAGDFTSGDTAYPVLAVGGTWKL